MLIHEESHAFAEDQWIGAELAVVRAPSAKDEAPDARDAACKLRILSACDRCPVVNVDQRTGRTLDSLPLVRLGRARRGAIQGSRGVPVGVLARADAPMHGEGRCEMWGDGPARLVVGDAVLLL